MFILFRTKRYPSTGKLNYNYRGQYTFMTKEQAKEYELKSRRIDKLYGFQKQFVYDLIEVKDKK